MPFITDKIVEFLTQQKDSFLAWVAVLLGLGSALYFSLLSEPSYMTTAGLFSGTVGFAVWCWYLVKKQHESLTKYLIYLFSISIFIIATGFMLAQMRTDFQGTPMITEETRPVKISGILSHIESQEAGKGFLLIIGDVKIDGWDVSKTPKSVRLTVRKNVDAVVGDNVNLLAKLTPPSPPVMPSGFDFARHYYFEGIGALGFALSDVEVIKQGEKWSFFLTKLRSDISEKVKETVPERQAGIVAALMTGERAAISDEDWQALRVSGLAHIISISGLHVAMVAAPIFFLVRFLLALIPFIALNYPIKKIAAGAALIVACLYVGLVVPSVPTTRALLMTGIMLIAIMLDRSPISMRLVAVSAIIVLVFEPESVWSASFQMSFAAVAALVAMAEVMAPYFSTSYRDAGIIKRAFIWVFGALLTSLVAFLATAPFSLHHFGQLATYSVFANFASIPLSGIIIMPMMIVSFVLMPFGFEGWSLTLMGKGIEWLLDVARYTETLPHAQVNVAAAPLSFLIWIAFAGMLLLFLRGRARLVSILPAIIAFYCLIATSYPILLISEDGRIIAVNENEKLTVSSLKRNKFISDSWRKYLGIKQTDIAAFPFEGIKENISCGGGMCRLTVAGEHIAYGEKLYELNQDCTWADIIITPSRTGYNFCGKKDKSPVIVDYYTLKKQGAIAFYTAPNNQLLMKTVAIERGIRPWANK